jgi:hypothetical protein
MATHHDLCRAFLVSHVELSFTCVHLKPSRVAVRVVMLVVMRVVVDVEHMYDVNYRLLLNVSLVAIRACSAREVSSEAGGL